MCLFFYVKSCIFPRIPVFVIACCLTFSIDVSITKSSYSSLQIFVNVTGSSIFVSISSLQPMGCLQIIIDLDFSADIAILYSLAVVRNVCCWLSESARSIEQYPLNFYVLYLGTLLIISSITMLEITVLNEPSLSHSRCTFCFVIKHAAFWPISSFVFVFSFSTIPINLLTSRQKYISLILLADRFTKTKNRVTRESNGE